MRCSSTNDVSKIGTSSTSIGNSSATAAAVLSTPWIAITASR